MKREYKTKYGTVNLVHIGNDMYEVYDTFDDTYYGTINCPNAITSDIIEDKLDALRNS